MAGLVSNDCTMHPSFPFPARSRFDPCPVVWGHLEAFDEKWTDAKHPNGSENHFGLIDLQGNAKYAIWDLVDQGVFKELTRGNRKITKSYGGVLSELMKTVEAPPTEYNRE